jgi:hypothetical protein
MVPLMASAPSHIQLTLAYHNMRADVMAAAGCLVAVAIIVSLSVGLARKSAMPFTCKDEGGASYDTTFFVVSAMQCAAAAVQLTCFCAVHCLTCNSNVQCAFAAVPRCHWLQ